MKKAYQMEVDSYEGASVVVFAETPAKAKSIAMCLDCYKEYKDLRPIRFPEADKFLDANLEIEQLNLDNPEHARFLRKNSWHCTDNALKSCVNCGFGVWDNIPESQLDADGICGECKELEDV